MKIVDKYGNRVTAADVERITSDATFQAIMNKVRSEQIEAFAQSARVDVQIREDAHSIIQALDKIEQALRSVIADEAIKEKRERGTF